MLTSEVQAAIVAAVTALVVAVIAQVGGYWMRLREQRRQSQIQYLYPLKVACDDLLDHWNTIKKQIKQGPKGAIGQRFLDVRNAVCRPGFYAECNDFRCGPVGTLYATACYFAYSRKLREQLPQVQISQKDALTLLEKTNAVRTELGKGDEYAFWTEIQDSIGQLVTTDTGQVVPYKMFYMALKEDYNSFIRLFNFYVDIELRVDYQFKWGFEALRSLHAELSRILKTPALVNADMT